MNDKKRKREKNDSFGKIKEQYFHFEKIEKYFKKKSFPESFQVISEKTWNDLDFHELFIFLDRTISKIGQQFLYSKLRVIPKSYKENNEQEELIEKFKSDESFRGSVQKSLSLLKKDEAYYITSLFQEDTIEKPKWFFVIPLLSFTNLLSIILAFFYSPMFVVFLIVTIINLGIHYSNKRNLYQYLHSLPQLFVLNKAAKELLLHDYFKEHNSGIETAVKSIDKLHKKASYFRMEANIQGDAAIIVWNLLEIFKIFFLIEPLLLFGVLKELKTKRTEIENVYTFIGKTDTAFSVVSLRSELTDWCLPIIQPKSRYLKAESVYHPLIENCVKNNLLINEKSILLTGSNMSGKTSFIRTLGINIICGLTINTCFAEQFEMPRMRVYSAIRISDDLMNSKSYYFEEVLTIKEMVKAAAEKDYDNLFLLDEIYKGTNTVERISAGKAVLSALAERNNIVFVSTHDIELADLLQEEYELYHFSESVNEQTVDFDYKLKTGKLQKRNAIKILEINGYPQAIIDEAIEIAQRLDKEREK